MNGLCPNNYTHIFYQKHPAIYVKYSLVLPSLGDVQEKIMQYESERRKEKRQE